MLAMNNHWYHITSFKSCCIDAIVFVLAFIVLVAIVVDVAIIVCFVVICSSCSGFVICWLIIDFFVVICLPSMICRKQRIICLPRNNSSVKCGWELLHFSYACIPIALTLFSLGGQNDPPHCTVTQNPNCIY